jgi:hypothetical protein
MKIIKVDKWNWELNMVAMQIKIGNCSKTCNSLYLTIISAKVDY